MAGFLMVCSAVLLALGIVLLPLQQRLAALLGSVPLDLGMVVGDDKARRINRAMSLMLPVRVACLFGGGLLGAFGIMRVFKPDVPHWFTFLLLALWGAALGVGAIAARIARTYQPDMNQLMQMAMRQGMAGDLPGKTLDVPSMPARRPKKRQ